ncbi:MAG: chorismate synthase [Chloroflexi bacterium]|nr:MAG: chorismate synthase [Chloroflexota bacterium]TMB97650.1 MAG: chorismate synthase [Chloroflexota bacterium]TMC29300.1 MAG: chorismate synthase [Chloroflexota bacterium]TMC33475.1 MAG: chorismate synthase [Chloroflexota bacterium]TMC54984.1 MAG: chorismate synthase [Chloroflexota bacterium]
MRLLTAGESHGRELVAIVDGVPAALALSPGDIDPDLRRRQLGYGRGARQRIERDAVSIVGGVRQGRTTGAPVALVIPNRDAVNWERVMSVEPVPDPPPAVTRLRPGHADLAGALKFAHEDVRDVIERSSARETAARVAAGAVAKVVLRRVGIEVRSETRAIGDVESTPTFDAAAVESSEVRSADRAASERMVAAIAKAREAGDTLGGIVALRVSGLVAGLGSSAQWDRRLDGRIAQALMSIQSAKGVQFADAFVAAREHGSAVHDPITVERGRFMRTRNRAGGLEGGMTNGEDVLVDVAFKPISTLMKPLPSADLRTGAPSPAHVERSDVCVVPAAGVVAEAMLAFVLADALLEKFGADNADDLAAAVERYRARLAPIDQRR